MHDDILSTISNQITLHFDNLGLEHYPFKIGWYNDLVSNPFVLDYHEDTLAFVILSTPEMFDNAFLPFIKKNFASINNLVDPIDQCMQYEFNKLKAHFKNYVIDIFHDFDMKMPSRRPKVLVQTAAHVSGAAYYYRPNNISNQELNKKLIGVCIHPKYGGWFAIRGVIIFRNILTPNLKKNEPERMISISEVENELLYKFNYEWQDGSYRDVIPVIKRYSELQTKYFSLKPSERMSLIKEIFTSI